MSDTNNPENNPLDARMFEELESIKPLHSELMISNPASSQYYKDILKMLAILEEHGCTTIDTFPAEDVIVKFPDGTTYQELFPRTTTARFRIMLPDKLELRMVDTQGKCRLSIVIETKEK